MDQMFHSSLTYLCPADLLEVLGDQRFIWSVFCLHKPGGRCGVEDVRKSKPMGNPTGVFKTTWLQYWHVASRFAACVAFRCVEGPDSLHSSSFGQGQIFSSGGQPCRPVGCCFKFLEAICQIAEAEPTYQTRHTCKPNLAKRSVPRDPMQGVRHVHHGGVAGLSTSTPWWWFC